MDYYSGGNGESSSSENYTSSVSFSNKFRDNSSIVLIIMAMAIVALIAGYLVYGINHENVSHGPDTNSSLSSITVTGGTIDPKFDSKTTNYTIYLDDNNNKVSFTCEAASSKSEIDNCDTVVDISNKKKVEHVIKVTAEDTSVTRYYFTVTRR